MVILIVVITKIGKGTIIEGVRANNFEVSVL